MAKVKKLKQKKLIKQKDRGSSPRLVLSLNADLNLVLKVLLVALGTLA